MRYVFLIKLKWLKIGNGDSFNWWSDKFNYICNDG